MNKINHYKQLDGLRAIAVILVLISHWINIPSLQKVHLGIMGVNLFFVLSGFLISEKLLIEKAQIAENIKSIKSVLSNFYMRRFLRIFPIYYLTIFILFAINWSPSRKYIVYLLTYTTNFISSFSIDVEPLVTFVHTWSLSVEEQYYIIIPILILTIRNTKKLSVIFILTGILSRILFYVFLHEPIFEKAIVFFTTSCFDAFGLGLLLAYLKNSNSNLLQEKLKNNTSVFIVLLLVYSIMLIVLFYNSISFIMVFDRFVFSLISTFMIGLACFDLNPMFIRKFLSNKIMTYIGKISYGVYLYHYFLSKFLGLFFEKIHVENIFTDMNVFFKFIIYFIITILIASASWYLIESPLNKLKKKFA